VRARARARDPTRTKDESRAAREGGGREGGEEEEEEEEEETGRGGRRNDGRVYGARDDLRDDS